MPPPHFLRTSTDPEKNPIGTGSGTKSWSRAVEGSDSETGNDGRPTISTPSPSLHSRPFSAAELGFSGSESDDSVPSSSAPSPPPPVDARRHYQGFKFVFATDTYHSSKTVHGREHGESINYLKPIYQGETINSLPPLRLPYFFTDFNWIDAAGQECTMSRVEVCDAWQIAFNRLIYYASFLEEEIIRLNSVNVDIVKDAFAVWNDLFCELDQTLGRLAECELSRALPKFQNPMRLDKLANPDYVTDAQTPFDQLSSTFLCAAREILDKYIMESESPPAGMVEIEKSMVGWEPCFGYPVVQASR